MSIAAVACPCCGREITFRSSSNPFGLFERSSARCLVCDVGVKYHGPRVLSDREKAVNTQQWATLAYYWQGVKRQNHYRCACTEPPPKVRVVKTHAGRTPSRS